MSQTNGELLQPFNDDLAIREIPVTLGKRQYVLEEASEDARIKYRDSLAKGMRLGPEGKPQSLDGISQAESVLVASCLKEIYQNNGQDLRRPVLLTTVRAWPSRVITALFERAEKISNLGQSATKEQLEKQITEAQEALHDLETHGTQEDRLKNSPSAGAGISV